MCSGWYIHLNFANTNRCEQFCKLLQEQIMEKRSGIQKASKGQKEKRNGITHERQPAQYSNSSR